MDYQIVEEPTVKVVGKALRVSTRDGENMRRIPQFWQECVRDGSHDQLIGLAARGVVLGDVILGICTDFSENMDEFTYMIAAEAPEGEALDGMTVSTIPAATWAVFEGKGAMPGAIQAVWGHIWSEFFPTSPFKHAEGPDLELYPSGDAMQDDYRFEVRVPVVKK